MQIQIDKLIRAKRRSIALIVEPDGSLVVVAGQLGVPGRLDGGPAVARFNHPAALAFDPSHPFGRDGSGVLYVADRGNAMLRVVGYVAFHNKPLIVKNVIEEPRFKEKEMARKLGLVAMVGVPLQGKKEKIIGVLNCFTSAHHEFSRTDITPKKNTCSACSWVSPWRSARTCRPTTSAVMPLWFSSNVSPTH